MHAAHPQAFDSVFFLLRPLALHVLRDTAISRILALRFPVGLLSRSPLRIARGGKRNRRRAVKLFVHRVPVWVIPIELPGGLVGLRIRWQSVRDSRGRRWSAVRWRRRGLWGAVTRLWRRSRVSSRGLRCVSSNFGICGDYACADRASGEILPRFRGLRLRLGSVGIRFGDFRPSA